MGEKKLIGVSFFLIIFSAIILCIFVVLIIKISIKPDPVPVPPILPSCDLINLDQLPNLGPSNTCVSGAYFYGDYLVSNLKVSPQNVCASYCDDIENYKCLSTDTVQVDNFNVCVKSLTNPDCTGPVPVAILDGVLQYPYQVKGVTC